MVAPGAARRAARDAGDRHRRDGDAAVAAAAAVHAPVRAWAHAKPDVFRAHYARDTARRATAARRIHPEEAGSSRMPRHRARRPAREPMHLRYWCSPPKGRRSADRGSHARTGHPWVALAAVRMLREGGCDEVAVVVGARGDEVAALVPDDAAVVAGRDWAEGLAAIAARAARAARLAADRSGSGQCCRSTRRRDARRHPRRAGISRPSSDRDASSAERPSFRPSTAACRGIPSRSPARTSPRSPRRWRETAAHDRISPPTAWSRSSAAISGRAPTSTDR